MKILIVDDDLDIRSLLHLYLKAEGYETIQAEDGVDALSKMDNSIDLVILDSMMPKMGGVETCLKIREQYTMPIIFLTAKNEDADKMIGFSSGADDYITKPFSAVEFISRVKANLRRYKTYNSPQSKNDSHILMIEGIEVNLLSHTVYKNNEPIKLTKTEFFILEMFLKNRAKVYTLEQIYSYVWNDDSILNAESTVSVHIRNLRMKIEDDIREPKIIKTVWGIGYRVD